MIDSWMNSGETNGNESAEATAMKYSTNFDDQDLSSCPPAEFPTTSIIEEEITPTSIFHDHETQSATVSTDEEGESLAAGQPSSPTHTVSSSNGHETVRRFSTPFAATI